MKKICVVGSINMDLVVMTDRFPRPGETITGREFHTFPGGKGANQAVAVGRLQADVQMIGKVGADPYGKHLLMNFEENGVNSEGVVIEPGISSGMAIIEVDGSGENHIVVIPGANGAVDARFIEEQLPTMLKNDIFLFQLETPLDTVLYAMKKLKQQDKTIILDPAPVGVLPDEIFQYVDYLTPNETEMALLTGRQITTGADVPLAAAALYQKGVGCVIIKAGKNGAYLFTKEGLIHCPGFTVNAVDTTGAGDAFNAGLAVALALGYGTRECVRFANAVGALATTAKGAQNAMPTFDRVISFID